HCDQERIPGSMARRIVRRLQPVDVDVGSHELSPYALRTVDLAPDGCEAGAAAAGSGQLVGPGILAVLGGLRAVFGRDLAVVDGLSTIFRRHLAIIDGSHAALSGLGA